MKSVCSCVSNTVNATTLDDPTNIAKNVLTHVGQAMNKPVVAPIPVNPPLLYAMENALAASEVLRPTRYVTVTTSTKFIGIICKPACSVIYTIISGMYPGSPQHAFMWAEGTTAS